MSFKMKFEIKNDLIDNEINRSKIKAPRRVFSVVHDTGNKNSTAKNNRDYLNRKYKIIKGVRYESNGKTPFRVASAHVFIDDKEILVTVPLDEKAWHVLYDIKLDNQIFGDDANDVATGIELCFFDDISRTKKAYERFVWFNAYLANLYGWKDISRRFVGHDFLDPKRKVDPMSAFKLLGKSYDEFLDDVFNEFIDCTTDANVPIKVEDDEEVEIIKVDLITIKTNTTEVVDGFVKDGVAYIPLRAASAFANSAVAYDSKTKRRSLSK
jgi:N-acetylmuramoyl-L-alanine amidase